MKTYKAGRPLLAALVLLAVIALAFLLFRQFGRGPELFGVDMTSGKDAISLSWEQVEGAERYVILRADVTEQIIDGSEETAREDYEEIAVCKAGDTAYKDTKATWGHCYAYIIDARKDRPFGGEKTIATTWMDGTATYQAAGLFQPDLLNAGYGENYTNSPHAIYLFSQSYTGIQPEGVELQRREEGGAFRTIPCKYPEGKGNWDGVFLLDDSVSPGTVYEYRARTTAKQDGRTVHSAWSLVQRIPAVNFEGTYTVKTLSNEGGVLTIALTSAKSNGALTFLPDCSAFYGTLEVPDSAELAEEDRQTAALQEVSRDSKSWQPLSEEGVTLTAGKTVYLRFAVPEGTPAALTVQGGSAEYDGPGSGETILTLDLTKGQGTVYCEWD